MRWTACWRADERESDERCSGRYERSDASDPWQRWEVDSTAAIAMAMAIAVAIVVIAIVPLS
jgi:hypothetical protein